MPAEPYKSPAIYRFSAELDKLIETSTELGVCLGSADIDDPFRIIEYYGSVFADEEISPPQQSDPLTAADLAALIHGSKNGQPTTMEIAKAAGAFFGAVMDHVGPETFMPPHVALTAESLSILDLDYEYPLAQPPQRVMEWGMGATGLARHVANLRQLDYALTAVQLYPGDAAFLQAAAERAGTLGITLRSGGIASNTEDMLKNGWRGGPVDLLIANRLVGAGAELDYGINNCSNLINKGGLLVAAGLCTQGGQPAYDRLAPLIENNPDLQLRVNIEARAPMPSDGTFFRRPRKRILIAQKVA